MALRLPRLSSRGVLVLSEKGALRARLTSPGVSSSVQVLEASRLLSSLKKGPPEFRAFSNLGFYLEKAGISPTTAGNTHFRWSWGSPNVCFRPKADIRQAVEPQ